MEDDLFSIDVVRDFISSKGGKVKNHDLVTHFKTFLNDPRCKASNRQKFKVFVNTLASVKLDETGEKVLVLKKKYRDGIPPPAPSKPEEERMAKLSAPKAKLKDTFQVRKPSEDDESISSHSADESLLDSIQRELVKSKISDMETPLPDYEDEKKQVPVLLPVAEPKPDYEDVDNNNEPLPDYDAAESKGTSAHSKVAKDDIDNVVDAADTSDVFVEDTVEEVNVHLDKDTEDHSDIQNREENVAVKKDIYTEKTVAEQKVILPPTSEDVSNDEVQEEFEEKIVDNHQSEEKMEKRSTTSQLGEVPEDDVLQTPQRKSKTNMPDTPVDEPVSVKDRAKHLNKISSQSELPHVPVPKKSNKKTDSDGDSMSSMNITLDPVEREWLIASAKADYHPMAKLINKHPNLAKRKDFVTTALHWAAKHGNIEIVKLLCGAGAAVNSRSGYTALHLASMHNNEAVIEILVETYSADSNLRDFSGKKPKQYLKNAASSRVQQLLQARRTSQSVGFKRSGSYSAKIGTAGHFGIKASTAMRTSWADGRHSVSRSPSQSPKDKRKGHKSSDDLALMPPPQDAPLRKKRSKRHPADSLGSSSNPEINKAESDPFLHMSDQEVNKPVHQSASYTSFV